ncbi:MAG: hypothetical protein ACTJHT_03440 [Sphingobacterium sp.]|uniref:hypothetical protein n=1 Tax=Sphingobacterium sp. JB170 TaxID=1434842 RepID=UPI00097ED540|nr:hypothetical protein [Sphingobacterium sp. JB170]SJN38960.1 hypothetical protein FM107_09890 [Sphingobacterium sp. JB170]
MKNTEDIIIKAFEVHFPSQIWKIVVDPLLKQIAVELRDPDSTLPVIQVLDFHGNILVNKIEIQEKEWTVEALQHRTLILKRVGDAHPIAAGIQLLNFEGEVRYITHEYTWVETCQDFIKIRHRSFQTGFEEYLGIPEAKKLRVPSASQESFPSAIKMPIPYTGPLPSFLKNIPIEDFPWVSRMHDKFLWSVHSKENTNYNLNLYVADASKVLQVHSLLNDMPKMIPQPYFQIANQIFLMSYNKREIVSYLV